MAGELEDYATGDKIAEVEVAPPPSKKDRRLAAAEKAMAKYREDSQNKEGESTAWEDNIGGTMSRSISVATPAIRSVAAKDEAGQAAAAERKAGRQAKQAESKASKETSKGMSSLAGSLK